jgi:flagellar motor protein MotB
MNEQGFTRVAITAFTDGVGGISGAKSLSSARAQSVARFLDRFLNVELKRSAKGISPNAKGSRPDANSRKAEVAVQ